MIQERTENVICQFDLHELRAICIGHDLAHALLQVELADSSRNWEESICRVIGKIRRTATPRCLVVGEVPGVRNENDDRPIKD